MSTDELLAEGLRLTRHTATLDGVMAAGQVLQECVERSSGRREIAGTFGDLSCQSFQRESLLAGGRDHLTGFNF